MQFRGHARWSAGTDLAGRPFSRGCRHFSRGRQSERSTWTTAGAANLGLGFYGTVGHPDPEPELPDHCNTPDQPLSLRYRGSNSPDCALHRHRGQELGQRGAARFEAGGWFAGQRADNPGWNFRSGCNSSTVPADSRWHRRTRCTSWATTTAARPRQRTGSFQRHHRVPAGDVAGHAASRGHCRYGHSPLEYLGRTWTSIQTRRLSRLLTNAATSASTSSYRVAIAAGKNRTFP